jgi:hypothetical protein
MVYIAGRDQNCLQLIDATASDDLSCTLLESALDGSSNAESSQVAFAGFVVWRSEDNGDRNQHDEQVFFVRQGRVRPLVPRTDLANHSPDRLSWGYCGCASAQLALAMLMEVLNDWPRVRRIYHDFHTLFVSRLPRAANWTADGSDILAWALELESTLPK